MAGWHLPSREEWHNLVVTAGGVNEAGKRLKARSGWYKKGNGTDDFRFSALPGGYRYSNGDFDNAENEGYWWTITNGDNDHAYSWYMGWNGDRVYETRNHKSGGFSVRCVEN